MTRGVVFLDIDGVLNSEAYALKLEAKHHQFGHTEPPSPERHQIDREAVACLNRIVAATDAKIVVSSTWRKLFDPPDLRRILEEHGLVAEIIGATPNGYKDPELRAAFGYIDRIFRGHEIDYWLQKHPEVDRFVILDDDSDMVMHKNRLVQTDCRKGLLDDHVDLAISVLAWDGKTAPSPMDVMEDAPEERQDAAGGYVAVPPAPAAQLGSSAGIHCSHEQHLREGGCPEKLEIKRTTASQPTHDDDYQHLMPALDEAAVSLGWRLHQCVWWCPTHVVAKNLACARCLSACPACSCIGGPRADAVEGIVVEATEAE